MKFPVFKCSCFWDILLTAHSVLDRNSGLGFRLVPYLHSCHLAPYVLGSKERHQARNNTAHKWQHCSNPVPTRHKPPPSGSWTVKSMGLSRHRPLHFREAICSWIFSSFVHRMLCPLSPRNNTCFHSQMQLILINVSYMLLQRELSNWIQVIGV